MEKIRNFNMFSKQCGDKYIWKNLLISKNDCFNFESKAEFNSVYKIHVRKYSGI